MNSIYSVHAARLVIDQRLRDADHERRRRLARHRAPYDPGRSPIGVRRLPGR